VTPSVAAPGDTNLNDATERYVDNLIEQISSFG